MSILDTISNFFSTPFNKNQTKVALKAAIIRIGMLRTRTEETIKKQKRDIQDAFSKGKDDLSRIWVEQVINNTELVHSLDIIQLFCEKLQARLDVIEISGNCCPPDDMLECVHSILFAAPRLSQIPELQTVKMQLTNKYKNQYVDPICLNGSCHVNQLLMHKLTVKQPEPFVVQKFLSDIVGPCESTHSHESYSSGSSAYNSGYATPVVPQDLSFVPSPAYSATPNYPGTPQSGGTYDSYSQHSAADINFPSPPPYPGESNTINPSSGPSGSNMKQSSDLNSAPPGNNFDFDDLTARFEALKHKK